MKPVRNAGCGMRSKKRGGAGLFINIPSFFALDKLFKHATRLYAVIGMLFPSGVIPHSALIPHYTKEVL